MSSQVRKSLSKVLKQTKNTLPMLTAVLLLLGLFKTYVTRETLATVFVGNLVSDSLVGGMLGSISAGNPITSYIIGGELLNQGISLFAVTAFIVTWVTVGTIQFPIESEALGKDFALKRNISSFLLALFVAGATVVSLHLLEVLL